MLTIFLLSCANLVLGLPQTQQQLYNQAKEQSKKLPSFLAGKVIREVSTGTALGSITTQQQAVKVGVDAATKNSKTGKPIPGRQQYAAPAAALAGTIKAYNKGASISVSSSSTGKKSSTGTKGTAGSKSSTGSKSKY